MDCNTVGTLKDIDMLCSINDLNRFANISIGYTVVMLLKLYMTVLHYLGRLILFDLITLLW